MSVDTRSCHYIERRETRFPYDAWVKSRQGFRRTIYKVLDLSAFGVRLWTDSSLTANDRIWLSLPTLRPSCARTIWTKGYVVGCEFSQALHPAVFDYILQGAWEIPSNDTEASTEPWALRSVA